MEKTFYNVICEELELLGGKVIHIDKNFGDMNEVHNFVIIILYYFEEDFTIRNICFITLPYFMKL